MSRFIFIFCILCITTTCLARIFSKCELVRELRRHGFPEHLMKDLVCLVGAESGFQTNIRGRPNWDGSMDWGLFQINDRYWCNAAGWPGKGCHIACNDLLSDDITVAANCTKKIMAYHGLDAWYGWVDKCKGKWLPDLYC